MSLAIDLTPDQSEQLIYSQLIGYGFPDAFSKLVTAQSGHETNGWTSNVYLSDNNGFGYGYTGSGYTSYDSVEDSVQDVAGYIQRKVDAGVFPDPSTITDPDQWAQLLKNADYYTDNESTYANGISRWFNDNLSTVVGISAGLIIFAVIGYFLLSKA